MCSSVVEHFTDNEEAEGSIPSTPTNRTFKRKEGSKMPTRKRIRVVLKFGTETLVGKFGKAKRKLDQKIFDNVARQVAFLRREQRADVVIVSSGAIKAGKEMMARSGINPNNTTLDKGQIAAVGMPYLLTRWRLAFWSFKMLTAPFWITYANWLSEPERRSVCSGILCCSHQGIIPIVNENDVVSANEIELMEKGISENDQLALMVASLIDADAVLFLTDVGGVYEADPKVKPSARMYEEIDPETARKVYHLLSYSSSNGTGGIRAKIRSALQCFASGRRVAIARLDDNVIIDFAKGKPVGTMIGPSTRFK